MESVDSSYSAATVGGTMGGCDCTCDRDSSGTAVRDSVKDVIVGGCGGMALTCNLFNLLLILFIFLTILLTFWR